MDIFKSIKNRIRKGKKVFPKFSGKTIQNAKSQDPDWNKAIEKTAKRESQIREATDPAQGRITKKPGQGQ